MAETEGSNPVSKVFNSIKTLYVIVEKQEQQQTKLKELTDDLRRLQTRYETLDRQIGDLQGAYRGIDDKIKTAQAAATAELHKAKDEMKDALHKAVDEMKSDLYRTKSDTVIALETEYAKRKAELDLIYNYIRSTSSGPNPLPLLEKQADASTGN